MKELLAAVPLTPRGAWSERDLRRLYDACHSKGRMVQIDVNLQGAGECNMNHSGAFCSPFSCAVVFEKWILSAQYFVQHFPHCSSFALQPCVWQNAARMQRLVSLEALPELFDVLEMVNEEVELSQEVQNLLEAIHHLGKDELISWQILRPFADANWYGQKQSLKIQGSKVPQKLFQSLPVAADVLAPPLQQLLHGTSDTSWMESLLQSATVLPVLRPQWRRAAALLCAEKLRWSPVAAELESTLAHQTGRLTQLLAQQGRDVPPDFLLPLQKLCEVIHRQPMVEVVLRQSQHAASHSAGLCIVDRSPHALPAETPTGCSCRAQPVPCYRPGRRFTGLARKSRRALVAAFDLQIPLDEPYRTWGLHDAPLDFLKNFDLSFTSGDPPERVLLLPPEHLARYPLTPRTRQRLRRAQIRLVEVPWIEPPVGQPNLETEREHSLGLAPFCGMICKLLGALVVLAAAKRQDVVTEGDSPTLVQSQQFRVASDPLGPPSDEARFLSLNEATQRCTVLRRSYLQSEDCGHTGHLPASGFLVTGTGRSGTKFLVKVLNALGLQVSHDTAKQRSADGAVSWVHGNHKRGCQLPWWSYNVSESFFSEVFLMLRDPLSQISSRSENGNLERREWYDFLSCSSRMNDAEGDGGPGPSAEEDSDVVRSLKTALKFYVLQNSFIEEYAARTFRVEDLRDDPQIIMEICSRNHSCNCSLAKVKEVMNEVGEKVNSNHTNKTANVTWSRLAALDRPFAVMAQVLAQRHGYVLPKEDILPEAAFGFSCGFDGPDEQSSRWTCKLNLDGKGLLKDKYNHGLSKLVAAKDSQRHCHLQSAQLKRSIVTLSIPMAGSGTGMTDASQLCQVSQVLANGARHVLVPLRHPLARLLTGFQPQGQFNSLNQFLDSLRNSSDEKHQLALDVAYRPGGANFLLPVRQFYLGDSVPSPERQQRVVSFICRCRMEEELKRISKRLHLKDVDFSGLEKQPDLDDFMLYDAMLPSGMGHGYSLAIGTAEGNYPAGPQGFLYHFFYMPDPAVDLALKRNGIVRPKSAQVDACRWNYNSFHGNFKWRYLDEYSYFAAMPQEWRDQVQAFHRNTNWTFPCDFTITKPVLIHHMDEAIESYLLHLQEQHPNRTTVLLPRASELKDVSALRAAS
eukprot:s1588_g1.t1